MTLPLPLTLIFAEARPVQTNRDRAARTAFMIHSPSLLVDVLCCDRHFRSRQVSSARVRMVARKVAFWLAATRRLCGAERVLRWGVTRNVNAARAPKTSRRG